MPGLSVFAVRSTAMCCPTLLDLLGKSPLQFAFWDLDVTAPSPEMLSFTFAGSSMGFYHS
jgi:hypothetical protein